MRPLYILPILALFACSSGSDEPTDSKPSTSTETPSNTPASTPDAGIAITPPPAKFAVVAGTWRQCVYTMNESSKLKTTSTYRLEFDGTTVRLFAGASTVPDYEGVVDADRKFKATRGSTTIGGLFAPDGNKLIGYSSWQSGGSYEDNDMVMYFFDGSETCPEHS